MVLQAFRVSRVRHQIDITAPNEDGGDTGLAEARKMTASLPAVSVAVPMHPRPSSEVYPGSHLTLGGGTAWQSNKGRRSAHGR